VHCKGVNVNDDFTGGNFHFVGDVHVETRALALSQVPMEIKGMESSLNHDRRIFRLINEE